MKKLILFPFLFLPLCIFAQAGIGINTTGATAHPSSMLDISSSGKGILIPRMNNMQLTGIMNPATGLLVYQTDIDSGFYYYSGARWIQLATIDTTKRSVWLMGGNANTNPAVHFIGTTDFSPLRFRVGNSPAGEINPLTSNTSFGQYAMPASTGTYNIAFGTNAMHQNTTGTYNTAVGPSSLYSNTDGSYNAAVGVGAGVSNTTGGGNLFSGTFSGGSNTTGQYNTFSGTDAGNSNTTASNNSFLGGFSGFYNVTGHGNTATGMCALFNNKTGSNLVAVGDSALYNQLSGSGENTAVGSKALFTNISGNNNTAAGYQSLYFNSTGSSNTAIGAGAINSNTSGSANTGVGTAVLAWNSSGSSNTAIGNYAMSGFAGAGSFNTAVGDGSLTENTASGNTGVGYNCLKQNSSGIELSALGYKALYYNVGSFNTALGYNALTSNTTGVSNFAAGDKAMDNNTAGSINTAAGNNALGINTTGSQNTAFGADALSTNTTGGSNTAVGFNANVSIGNLSNTTTIGFNAITNTSNKIVIGNTAVTVIGGYAAAGWSILSDARFKENIKENVPGLDFIIKLKPVTYTLNIDKLNKFLIQDMPDSAQQKYLNNAGNTEAASTITHTGFIAQDVAKTAEQLGYAFDGVNKPANNADNYSIVYSGFVMPLVKAVQEQQKQIETVTTENQLMKEEIKKLQETVELLKQKNK